MGGDAFTSKLFTILNPYMSWQTPPTRDVPQLKKKRPQTRLLAMVDMRAQALYAF
jgi:hypothetical protein